MTCYMGSMMFSLSLINSSPLQETFLFLETLSIIWIMNLPTLNLPGTRTGISEAVNLSFHLESTLKKIKLLSKALLNKVLN